MVKRMGIIMAVLCVSLLSMSLLAACGATQSAPPKGMSDIPSESGQSVADNDKVLGVWRLAGFETDNDAFAKVYPIEELENEARWSIEDNIELFMISGSYIEFAEDGTYASYTGQLNEQDKAYELEKTREGTWKANDDGTYTLIVDGVTSTLTIDSEDDNFCGIKSDAENTTYAIRYCKEDIAIADIEPAPIPQGIVYSARANVCRAACKSAVSNAVVDDKGSEDEADDTISVDIDTSKVNDTWSDNKPYVVIEECEGYPNGLAIKVEKIDQEGDIWHVEGVTPDINNFILIMNESA